jgi:capsular polysaccharide transport system ATP-binding protein
MAAGARIASLVSVAKVFHGRSETPQVVFRPTSVSFPTDRPVAILGHKRTGKSALLKILARRLTPDRGALIGADRFSPLANAGGLFHAHLTPLENLRVVARLYSIDADHLAAGAAALCDGPEALFNSDEPARRRALETATILALPFECYLIDDAGFLSSDLLARSFAAAAARGSGALFATPNPRLARQYAEAALVIADRTIYPFADIEEGLEFFDRQPR